MNPGNTRYLHWVRFGLFGVAIFLFGVVTGFTARPWLTAGDATPAAASPASRITVTPPGPRPEPLDSVVSRTRHFKGHADAPVTIVEFSDFQ